MRQKLQSLIEHKNVVFVLLTLIGQNMHNLIRQKLHFLSYLHYFRFLKGP